MQILSRPAAPLTCVADYVTTTGSPATARVVVQRIREEQPPDPSNRRQHTAQQGPLCFDGFGFRPDARVSARSKLVAVGDPALLPRPVDVRLDGSNREDETLRLPRCSDQFRAGRRQAGI